MMSHNFVVRRGWKWPLALALTILSSLALAGPFEEIQVGEWREIPNSRISSVLPDPVPPGNGPANIIDAWNSGAYDTTRDRLIIWGGGHNDYGGNEIYAFDIASLTWSRIWGPSPDIPPTQGSCNQTYSDGNPVSRHTYDGLEYLPLQDAFWMHGGSLYCGPGWQSSDTWTFEFGAGAWNRRADLPATSVLEMVSAYDPTSGNVYLAGPTSALDLWEYNPVSNQWRNRGGGSVDYAMTAAFDYTRQMFVAVGNGSVVVFDLSGSSARRSVVSTSGPSTVVNSRYPGLDYDPVSDRIVAWVGGSSVYTLDLDSLTWTQHGSTNGVVPSQPPSTGIFNRWRYIPSQNAFIVVNGIDQNVFIYKLTDGGGIAPPVPGVDTLAPAAAEQLIAQ
jgi:hypothetical protein